MKKDIRRYQLSQMWGQVSENDNYYIRKNDDVCGTAHWHDCCEIEVVIKGSCKEVINENVFPASVGDITFILPTDLHEVADINDLTIYNLMFETEIIDNEILDVILANDKDFFSCHLSETDFNYALSVLDRASKESHKREFGYERFGKDAINQLLIITVYPHPKRADAFKDTRDEADTSVKPPVCYGWDWHPRLLFSGMWQEAYIETRKKGHIHR